MNPLSVLRDSLYFFRRHLPNILPLCLPLVVLEALVQSFGLTAREAEVLYWVVKGKINRDIGDILGASPATVKKHLERIHAKLGVETRTAAAAMAINRVPLLQPQHGG